MKNRVLFLAIFAFVAIAAQAQTPQQLDTIHIGERHSCYYYWDTNWWDYYYLNYPVPENSVWGFYRFSSGNPSSCSCKGEITRFCQTDTALTILGIAAISSFYVGDNTPSELLPEYFRLYKPWTNDKTGEDEMELLAETRWDTASPSHYMFLSMYRTAVLNDDLTTYSYYPDPVYHTVYESYFPNPVTVRDSFYVGGTLNNNFSTGERDSACFNGEWAYFWRVTRHYPIAVYFNTHPYPDAIEAGIVPKPSYYKIRLHQVDAFNYFRDYEAEKWYFIHTDAFVNFFPIIDTGRRNTVVISDSCPTPTNMRLLGIRNGQAVLGWNDLGLGTWEVAVWSEDLGDSCRLIPTSAAFVALSDLDSARCYFACVRTVCEEGMKSAWSDTIRFCMPADSGEGDVAVSTIEEQTTQLMPNPASGKVTVYSSFRIATVEVFSMKGERMMKQTVDGLATTIDVSSLPAGAYMVRIDTNRGTVYKKLIVQ